MKNEKITKKEFFAGMALQGLISKESSNRFHADDLAYLANEYADALILLQEEGGKPVEDEEEWRDAGAFEKERHQNAKKRG